MATKKAKQKKRLIEGETPITIGGGGGSGVALPLTISYDPSFWVASSSPPGTLTLQGGRVKKVLITTADIEVRLPLSGGVTIDLKCGRPQTSRPKPGRR